MTQAPLTTEELINVVASAQGEMKTLFVLGYHSALRAGDCFTLKWSEVDFKTRMITRVPNKTRSRGNQAHRGLHAR